MKILLQNIKQLVQAEETPVEKVSGKEMARLPSISDAFVLLNDELIEDFGKMSEMSRISLDDDLVTEIDCKGRLVFPAWCDSHTHLVFAGSREEEFVGRIKGQSYDQIASQGGGILNSARLLKDTPAEVLYEQAAVRIQEIMRHGTGAVEIKSGYGLTPVDEIKILRVIQWLRQTTPISIRATFLGAHAVPEEYRGNVSRYVDQVISEMIPQVASEELADYIDVFCEEGYFSPEDTERILMAGMKYGLRPKIHANELSHSGGVEVGVKYNALSVDHLEYISDRDVELLRNSDTMPAILPGASFFLNMPYAPARKIIDSGLPIALASDYNPGSSPSGNMNFIGSLGCLKLNLLPEEVVNACTINGAYAMGISDRLGSIARGKTANLFITSEISGIASVPYNYGSNLIDTLILNGEIQSLH
jgi:imidazolonepropionase